MPYAVKEIFRSLQGEGHRAGRVSVFCRFAGCNLWTGRASYRESAVCSFCDTDFVGTDGTHGGKYPDAKSLVMECGDVWGPDIDYRYVVLTGGEPMLQVNEELVRVFHRYRFEVAVETNGTVPIPFDFLDWVTVSPKAGTRLVVREGQEIKVVYPQPQLNMADLGTLNFKHFFVQPMDGPDVSGNTKSAVEFCLKHPRWRLSLQTHKVLGIR